MLRSRSRRSFIQSGLSAGLALAAQRGLFPLPDIAAEKKTIKKKSSVQARNQSQRELCKTLGGGTLEVNNMGGCRWETTCHGGSNDGYAYTNTAKSSVCVSQMTHPDGPTQPLEPQSPLADPDDIPDIPLEPADVTLPSYRGDEPRHGRRRRGKGRQH